MFAASPSEISSSAFAACPVRGLTVVIVGVLFLATMFVAPFAQLVMAAATAPALILVGEMTVRPLAEVEWDDPVVAIRHSWP